MMWRYGGVCPWCGGSGGGGVGSALMLLFGLLVVVGVVLLIIWVVRQAGNHEDRETRYRREYTGPTYPEERIPSEDPAVAAARHRYARGEISREELDEILATLRERQ